MTSQQCSAWHIARTLHRSPSTITHELIRFSCWQDRPVFASETCCSYHARAAGLRERSQRFNSRRCSKLAVDTLIFGVVQHFLPERWSSLQIAGTLKVIWPDAPQRTLSHEATYNCIHAMHRGQLRKELIACLHRVQGKRMLRPRGQDRRGQLLDALSIHVRPPEAKERAFPVQWEGDLIKGACDRSALNVLGGRSSREVMLVKMANATAVSALEGFPAKMRSIAEPDAPDVDVRPRQGDGRRTELTLNMGILMYFCDQHSFWQRGSCEKEIIS